MIALLYLEMKIRKFFADLWDHIKFTWEEIRNEGKNDDEWIFVEIERPRHKIGSSR